VTTVRNQSRQPELSEPERACLALAWEAFLAGTNPVGAVVIDAAGRIVASGRNAVYEASHPTLLAASRLAHAEINALFGLAVDARHGALRLVTSLEPCQMCAGAVRMATVGALTYIGADPVNGTAWALASARFVNHRPVQVTGPRTDRVGLLASGLAAAFVLARSPAGNFAVAYRQSRPDLAAVAQALIDVGLLELAARREPWADVAPVLLDVAAAASPAA
jgi:tRNA(adenine34) deaminase